MKNGGQGGAMSRILVLMDHKENRRLLADWLATRYTVLPQETDEAVDEQYDLGILDGTALDRLADRIQNRKKYQQTVFLPFLLVTAAQHVDLVTRHLWKSIDEVIHSPIDKVELQARVEVLLRARRQAVALRQAGERALRQSEERLGLLIEGVRDYALFLIDPSGHVSGWNSGAQRLLGYEAEEIIGQPFSQFFTHEDRQNGTPERELETARTMGRASDDNWLVRKDGSRFWASGLTTALQNRDLRGYVKVVRDLSERQQAKEQVAGLLEREKQQTARLVQVAAASLTIHSALSVDSVLRIITDEARRILDTHQAVSSIWEEGRRQKAEGSPDWLSSGKPMRLTQAELEAPTQGIPGWLPSAFCLLPSGKPLRGWLAAPFVGRDGRNLGLIQVSDKVDGSDFTAADEAILMQLAYIASVAIGNARLVDDLREADRRKDEFLATLAHELRNPLAPIRNALQILRLAGNSGPIMEQARTMMERQLMQLVRLVDDLLDVSRITRGRVELRKERVELAAVVQSAVETSRPLIEAAGHELMVTLAPEPIHLDADLTRLAQVFSNLLNNAAKYTEQGGHIWLTAERHGGEVVLKVRDTGLGISADMLLKIFEMFTQVDRSLERSRGGLGIGLTLVKRLVEMHGGSVEARSEGPGKGSEFTVRLPVAMASASHAPQPPKGEGEKTPAPAPRRILVVDDNKDAADSLSMMLSLAGMEARTAYDGLEAVAAAAAFHPDVVLLDIGLPKLNGYEAARRIREQPWGKDMVLVAVTGWGQEEDRRRSQEAGFNAHLVKPVDPVALQQMLAALK
jgi:PAS domain S-box-containing protein